MEAGDLDAAEDFYWQGLERGPAKHLFYIALNAVRSERKPGDALGIALLLLGVRKLALAEEIPPEMVQFFRENWADSPFDLSDPSNFELLADSIEVEQPPEVTERLLPYR